MPAILDTAIGVIFIFLLFSLIVSALNEVILSNLDRRAAFLREGIKELFRDSGEIGKATLTADAFFQHGMIAVLSRHSYQPLENKAAIGEKLTREETKGVPSYIPGKSFVLALLSLLTDNQKPESLANLRGTIEKLGNTELKQTLLSLYDDAEGRLDHFKANLENWFNENMDRVGGWYKQYAQKYLLRISLLLAVICNIDSIRLIGELSASPATSKRFADSATAYVASLKGQSKVTPEDAAQILQDSTTTLQDSGLSLGWANPASHRLFTMPQRDSVWNFVGLWLSALAGWTITGLAASLGAPFWFDILNRFIDIRGVGRAPEERDTTAPKKPSTGVESYVRSGDSLGSTSSLPALLDGALARIPDIITAWKTPDTTLNSPTSPGIVTTTGS